MEARLQKAKSIVQDQLVKAGPNFYMVQSQTGTSKGYHVILDGLFPSCTCDDFELTGADCKHILAAKIFRAQQASGGPAPIDQPGPKIPRKTYKQDWANYNAAQVNEGHYVRQLLFDLCQTIPELPVPTGKGRRPIPLRDRLYAACLKVYGGLSARRSMSDLEQAHEDGFLSKLPCYNSVINVLDDPATAPILTHLVRLSSLPLASVEVDFAADSTGFSSCKYTRWFDQKYGKEQVKADWVKCHLMCGVRTNIVTAVTILDQNSADSPQLPGLVKETRAGFTINDVCTDKAYTGTENFQAVYDAGGNLYSPFKSNTTGAVGGIFERAFHFFNLHRQEFLEHYHKRSNVESTISAIKRKFGDSVRGKTETSMKNEVLAKIVCYNLTVCISEWYTLGIQPIFLAEPKEERVDILRFPRRG